MAGHDHWHDKTVERALTELNAMREGLTSEEAARRLARVGPNRLAPPPAPSLFARFVRQFRNLLIYLLIGAACITAWLGHWADTLVIGLVVVVNTVIGFIQEGKAEKALSAIRMMLAPSATVLRDGRRNNLDAQALVPGDIVLLEAGDKVPADLRLLQVHDLNLQEALLTGESMPVRKSTEPVATDTVLGDRTAMAYSGTLVTRGQGRGVVVATGPDTEIGRISGLLTDIETLTTPLVRQMNVFARRLTAVILAVAVLVLVLGYTWLRMPFDAIFMAVVGLTVAAIPEGLTAIMTITLATGVRVMARRNAIVRRLPAIETLGAVSVICTDKTGTLTRNEMTVTAVHIGSHRLGVDGVGYRPEGAIEGIEPFDEPDRAPGLLDLLHVAVLCNDAHLVQRNGDWWVEGDPMEGALITLAGKAGIDGPHLQRHWTRSDVIPFDAEYRYMATLNRDHQHHARIAVKGAPESLLSRCRTQRDLHGEDASLDTDHWHRQIERLSGEGMRVLGFAIRTVGPEQTTLEHSDLEDGLVWLGLVGLIDPPRPEAIRAIAECHEAGIRVKMITGDHAGTAAAIGRGIGLDNPDAVLTGVDLDALTDDQLTERVIDTDIFARTSPEHKLRLVKALQARGAIVAMTGDGVNDAPALKRADAGIAMGRKGSEAAKEASDLVLADDNFASIVAAVREGRTVYDNIKKVIGWGLPTSSGEAMTIVFALLAGLALPISPVQILWVNMITAITLGLALVFEPTEPNTMKRPPRRADQPLLTGELVWYIVLVTVLILIGVFGIYRYALAVGYSHALASTLALNTLVVMEMFQLFFIRNLYGTSISRRMIKGTPVLWLTVGLVTAAQFALTYLEPMQRVFGTAAVAFRDGLIVVGIGVSLFLILELEKQIRLRLFNA